MTTENTIAAWAAKGKYAEIYKNNVFYIENKSEKPTIAFLHGYPSASFDYYKALPFIGKEFSYILHDHLGFGLSDKPLDYSYSLIEQAEVAMALWQKLGLKEIHLVAHDYGTSVANEIMVRRMRGFEPVKIKSVTFCNGSMHVELAQMKVIQKLLKHPFWGKYVAALSSESLFVNTMRDIWFDKTLFDPIEIKILYTMLMSNGGRQVFHKVSQYNNERVKYWHRWIGNLPHIDIPTHILWAQQDLIAVKAIAELLHTEMPHSVYTKIENCGHYPMLEQPELWATLLIGFIRKIDTPSV